VVFKKKKRRTKKKVEKNILNSIKIQKLLFVYIA
jgi:hypothetical protein